MLAMRTGLFFAASLIKIDAISTTVEYSTDPNSSSIFLVLLLCGKINNLSIANPKQKEYSHYSVLLV